MKTSFTSHEITLTFCTLSTSLLLAAPLAARAEGPANAWYGPAALPTGEPGLAPTLLIDNASTWGASTAAPPGRPKPITWPRSSPPTSKACSRARPFTPAKPATAAPNASAC